VTDFEAFYDAHSIVDSPDARGEFAPQNTPQETSQETSQIAPQFEPVDWQKLAGVMIIICAILLLTLIFVLWMG